jgi:hypothetical protein
MKPLPYSPIKPKNDEQREWLRSRLDALFAEPRMQEVLKEDKENNALKHLAEGHETAFAHAFHRIRFPGDKRWVGIWIATFIHGDSFWEVKYLGGALCPTYESFKEFFDDTNAGWDRLDGVTQIKFFKDAEYQIGGEE